MNKLVNINVRGVPEKTWRDFRAVALLKGFSTAELMANVLKEYLDKQQDFLGQRYQRR